MLIQQTPENEKTFCPLPFAHICTDTSGDIVPCCHAKGPVLKENGQPYSIAEGDRFADAFHSPYMHTLRQNLLTGVRDSRCALCWKLESLGIESKRQNEAWLKKRLQPVTLEELKFEPVSWDIKLGAHCNLKCRMCYAGTSSAIMKEAIENGWIGRDEGHATMKRRLNFLQNPEVKSELMSLLPYVYEMYFLGGEPTMMREHLELVDAAIEKNYAKNMCVRWSTNLTHFDQEFIGRAKHFGKVIVDCSIDGFGEVNEYIRAPSAWSQVESRIEQILAGLPAAEVKVICTVQTYNIFRLEEMIAWCKGNGLDLNLNFLDHPPELSAQALPAAIRGQISAKYASMNEPLLEPVMKWLEEPAESRHLREFFLYTARLDRARGQNFMSIVPEEFKLPMAFARANIFREVSAGSRSDRIAGRELT